MNSLEFNKNELMNAIENVVPIYQKELVLSTINLEQEIEYENIGLRLTGEQQEKSNTKQTSAPIENKRSMWIEVKSEVYEYICTKSKKYSRERNNATATIEQIITIIATSIAASFSVAIGVITGAVTVALISCLKIGKNAWCNINKPD